MDGINKFILAFLSILIGVALIGTLATSTLAVTDKTIVYDETFDLETLGCIHNYGAGGQINGTADADCNITVANAPSGWKINDCPIASVVVENTSAGTYTALTEGTDYNEFTTSGIIQMLNTSSTDAGDFNNTYLSYNYCGDDYLNSSWGRTTLLVTIGLFAFALLGIGRWLFYSMLKDTGVFK